MTQPGQWTPRGRRLLLSTTILVLVGLALLYTAASTFNHPTALTNSYEGPSTTLHSADFEEEALLDHLGVPIPHELPDPSPFKNRYPNQLESNLKTNDLGHLPLEPTLAAFPPPPAPSLPAVENAKEPIQVSILPKPRLPPSRDDGTKYIGFLPHSGFHNQRSALQNAFMLGAILNRTV